MRSILVTHRTLSRTAYRSALLLLAVALAACSDTPTGTVITAADQPASLNTAPTVTVTNSGGNPLISWGALAGATSYSVVYRSVYTMYNGTIYRSQSNQTLGSTSGTSWLDTTKSYIGVSSCFWDYGTEWERTTQHYVVTATFASGTSTTTVDAPVSDCAA
jgi:hypothetical protein